MRGLLARVPGWIWVALLSFCWFWFFRAFEFTGGDSEQWEREITGGVWLRKRQMLSFAFMQLSHQVVRALFDGTAHVAINFTSCAAGAAAMAAAWQLFEGMRHRGWAFALLATGGWTMLFHGHIETYAQPAAALLFHLLAVRRVQQRRWALWSIPATFLLTAAFHLVVLFAAPAMMLALLWEGKLRGAGSRAWLALAAWLLGLAVFLLAVSVMGVGHGEFVGSHFVAESPAALLRAPWLMVTHPSTSAKLVTAIWNAGAAGVLVWWVVARDLRRRRHDRFALVLAGYFFCFVGFFLVWRPDMLERDWDLFSFPWIVGGVICARRLMTMPRRSLWVGLVLGINLLIFVQRTLPPARVGERGYGRIEVELADGASPLVLLDERTHLRGSLGLIGAGVHRLDFYNPRAVRIVVLEPGTVSRWRVTPGGVEHLEQPALE